MFLDHSLLYIFSKSLVLPNLRFLQQAKKALLGGDVRVFDEGIFGKALRILYTSKCKSLKKTDAKHLHDNHPLVQRVQEDYEEHGYTVSLDLAKRIVLRHDSWTDICYEPEETQDMFVLALGQTQLKARSVMSLLAYCAAFQTVVELQVPLAVEELLRVLDGRACHAPTPPQ